MSIISVIMWSVMVMGYGEKNNNSNDNVCLAWHCCSSTCWKMIYSKFKYLLNNMNICITSCLAFYRIQSEKRWKNIAQHSREAERERELVQHYSFRAVIFSRKEQNTFRWFNCAIIIFLSLFFWVCACVWMWGYFAVCVNALLHQMGIFIPSVSLYT